MAIDDYLNEYLGIGDTEQPNYGGTPAPGAEPYTNWNDEQNWWKNEATRHVQSKPFLFGKVGDSDIAKAFTTYNTYRQSEPNRGDAFNKTLDDLGWWTGSVTSAPKSAGTSSGASNFTRTGDMRTDFLNIAKNYAPSAKNLEQFVYPAFAQLYPGTTMKRNASGYVDAIILPNGMIIDTQRNAGYESSDAWQWLNPDNAPVKKSGSSGSGGALVKAAGGYDDPNTKLLVKAIQDRLASLKTPYDRTPIDAYIKELQQPTNYIDDLVGKLRTRTGELAAPAYTDSERDIKRTQFIDPLKRSKEALAKRRSEELMAQGHAPTSGTIQQVLQDLDREYAGAQAPIEANLMLEERDENQRRKDQALGLESLIASALGGQRNDKLGSLATITELEEAVRQIKEGREREYVTTASGLPALDERRMLLALQAFGATPGGNASGALNDIMALLSASNGMNQTAIQNAMLRQQQSQQNTANWMAGLAQLAGLFTGA